MSGPRTMLLTLPDRYMLLCHDLNRRLREPDTQDPRTDHHSDGSPRPPSSPSQGRRTPLSGSQNPRYGWRTR